jgi:hypothetical protein
MPMKPFFRCSSASVNLENLYISNTILDFFDSHSMLQLFESFIDLYSGDFSRPFLPKDYTFPGGGARLAFTTDRDLLNKLTE